MMGNMNCTDQEAHQYITWESFYENMHKLFGVRNYFFAKMFFSHIIDHKSMSSVVNY